MHDSEGNKGAHHERHYAGFSLRLGSTDISWSNPNHCEGVIMNAPQIPVDFYPDEDQEERIVRWLTLEAEAQEMQRRDLQQWEEPQPPRLPHWMQGCCNESVLRYYGDF